MSELDATASDDEDDSSSNRNAVWNPTQVDWQGIIEHSPDLILAVGPDAQILYMNRVVEGVRLEDVIGQPATSFIPEHEHAVFRERITRVFTNRESIQYEMSGDGPNGTAAWYFSSMSPVVDDDKVVAATIITRDITGRRQAEITVQEALEREKDAADRLRLLDERHRDFTAKVVHDLRTPITIIDGFARTLLDGQVDATSEERVQYLKLISDASTRLTELVDAVLEVFRLEAEEVTYEIAPNDIMASVHQTILEIDPTASRITVSAPDGPLMVDMDIKLHERILSNLLSNALKFSPGDSVTRVHVTKGSELVSVAVTDQGIGIRTDDHHLLFQKFSQVNHGTDHSYRGTGLGLYICRTMLEAQGGSIEVMSELGKGATFTYHLPLSKTQ